MKKARPTRRIVVAWIPRHAHALQGWKHEPDRSVLADQGLVSSEMCSGMLRSHLTVVGGATSTTGTVANSLSCRDFGHPFMTEV